MRYRMSEAGTGYALEARIPARSALLEGEAHVGDEARGIVLFAHGSGSSRHSPRNQFVARSLQGMGLAALVAAAELGNEIGAVVSRGGRPDLAADALPRVKSPTLLIVGGLDEPVIRLNKEALALLRCEKQLRNVPGATHLFEEPGTLEEVARLAGEWFGRHLRGRPGADVHVGKGA